jgi:hypothetical protein
MLSRERWGKLAAAVGLRVNGLSLKKTADNRLNQKNSNRKN